MKQINLWSGLSTETKPISRYSCLHYLRELEEHLDDFYIPYVKAVNEPYSMKEQEAIVRIIKLLIRQLFGTPKYYLFSHKKKKCCTPASPEEKQELRDQKTDEIRMKNLNPTLYNPVSKKYKALKQEHLQKLEEQASGSDLKSRL